jgi:tetratricopeptide (TPR) repeat protein
MAKYTRQDIRAVAQMINHAKGQGRPFALLTGAGCSFTAKIPMVPQLLEAINQSGLGENIRQKLQTDNLVKKRYGEVMAFLNPEERKEIIGPFLKNAKVNWGNLALAGLMKENFIGRVLTFNFDSVHTKACGINGHYPAIYDFSQVPEANGDFNYIAPSAILHLHGQGTSLTMMNSEAETRAHAKKLEPLFKDTLHRFDMIVIGYSGEADEAFETFKTASSNRRLIWCSFENSLASHVRSLIDECGNMGQHFEEVDFDEFMIDLATELKCFPPLVLTETTKHLESEIANIVPPPDSLKGAVGLLEQMQHKLKEWRKSEGSVESQLRNALLRNDWDAAINLKDNANSNSEKELLAWAYIGKGNELSDAAILTKDEAQLQQSIEAFQAALGIKPDSHEALNNWGNALANLARAKGNDETLWREAIEKFEAALAIKPDSHDVLSNWGLALTDLAQAKGNDETLWREAITKYEAALGFKPDSHEALYNWGNTLAALAEAKGNEETLLREAMEKYEAALRIKPDKHQALYNWGLALAALARAKGNDETLWREAIAKYEAALRIKPDSHEALDNWVVALLHLNHKSPDGALLVEAEAKAAEAQRLQGKASYKLACVYALQKSEDDCHALLLRCKADGTLPDAAHMAADNDLEAYWEREWFKALLA